MENENIFVTGEASKQAFTQIHHADGLVAPIIPRHLVPALKGYSQDYVHSANFPWDSMVCYMLDLEESRVPAAYIEHGMTTDYFGSGLRSNGYNVMGGIVTCSGGIFLSQQNTISSTFAPEGSASSYSQSMESFNMYLAPLMNRPDYSPTVGIIYSKYRGDFYLFSSMSETWGARTDPRDPSEWTLPDGWGLVGSEGEEGYIGWLNVLLSGNFSEELNAACRYLLNVRVPSDDK